MTADTRNWDASQRMTLGANSTDRSTTHFRVWASKRQTVEVELLTDKSPRRFPLVRGDDGFFDGVVSDAPPGSLYRYVLDGDISRPDPASRFQPQGVHGPSQIVDPHAFTWTDDAWSGIPKRDLVIYELHVGTFTEPGTFRAAIERIPELVELGVTAIELLPVNQTPGRWNWGYDGVDLFAVRDTYGPPDDLKALVDACHAHGLAVVLDLVYNHVGPEGNYLADFGPYFSGRHKTPWGDAFNFDGPQSEPVRQFIIDNALFWLSEYHLDGLRLDAVHFMFDTGPSPILDDVRRAVSGYADTVRRDIHLIAEANVYDPEFLETRDDRPPFDAIWCDCLMHAVYSHGVPDLRLTRRRYHGFDDIAHALKYGFIFAEPEPIRYPLDRHDELHQDNAPITSLIIALQTHDSVGNHPQGKRLHQLTSKSFQKAAAPLFLLYPGIPMLFMGEEAAVDAPFPFFADFGDEHLREAVDKGRQSEYPHHDWSDSFLPSNPQAFHQAKCHPESLRDNDMLAWYRELIAFRKQGLAAGWLSPEKMATRCAAEHGLCSIAFDGDGTVVHIHARLTPPENCDTEPVRVPITGNVLLASDPEIPIAADHVLLAPNRAVVTESRKTE